MVRWTSRFLELKWRAKEVNKEQKRIFEIAKAVTIEIDRRPQKYKKWHLIEKYRTLRHDRWNKINFNTTASCSLYPIYWKEQIQKIIEFMRSHDRRRVINIKKNVKEIGVILCFFKYREINIFFMIFNMIC